jgi:cytochrome b561
MTAPRYHPLLVALHWVVAVLILGMLAVGFLVIAPMSVDDPAKIGVLKLHMATGALILALMLARVIVRWRTRTPENPSVARLAHLGLYLLIFALIGAGFATAVLTGVNLVVFGAPGQSLPAGLEHFPTRVAHVWLAIALALLIAWHVGAAALHQIASRRVGEAGERA